MRRFIRYLYEYEQGRRLRNVGFVKVEQGDDDCTLHIHGKGLHMKGERKLELYLFYGGDECVGIWQGIVDNVNPAVNYRLYFTREDVIVPENFDKINGIILESELGHKYAAVWNEGAVNVGRMRVLHPESVQNRKESGDDAVETAPRDEIQSEAEGMMSREEAVEEAETGTRIVQEEAVNGAEGMMSQEKPENEPERRMSQEEPGREPVGRVSQEEPVSGPERRMSGEEPVSGSERGMPREELGREPASGPESRMSGEEPVSGPERGMSREELGREPVSGPESRMSQEEPAGGPERRMFGDEPAKMPERRTDREEPAGGTGRTGSQGKAAGGAERMLFREKQGNEAERMLSLEGQQRESMVNMLSGEHADQTKRTVLRGEARDGADRRLYREEPQDEAGGIVLREELQDEAGRRMYREEPQGSMEEIVHRETVPGRTMEMQWNRGRHGEMQRHVCSDQKEQEAENHFRCTKIQRNDLAVLPRCEWKWANNSFLLHGYYNYHHLAFIDDGEKFRLGVPGIYHPQEAKAASTFGFTEFIPQADIGIELTEDEKSNEEQFGYWCRPIKRPLKM